MSVTWEKFRCNDIAPGLTLEEVFRRFGSYSGIHDFEFEDLSSVSSIAVSGTATGWNASMLGVDLPPNFSIKYHKTDDHQGILISDLSGGSSGGIYYHVTTDASGYPEILYASTPTFSVPRSTPTEADVEIVFRQQILDDTENIVWRTITVYMNDAWVTTHSDYLSTVGNHIDIGFLSYGNGTVTEYSDIRVPELCDIAEFGTIDPGETPLGGLQRTIEGRYLKIMSRFDGSLRAWKKKQRDNVVSFTSSVKGIQRNYDIPSLITHARMMGAYVWAEDIDSALIGKYGHRFKELNNSMLLTRDECYEESTNSLKRSQEEAFGISWIAQHIPVLEPEDRVSVDGDDWIIDSYSSEISNGRIRTTYRGRSYVWE